MERDHEPSCDATSLLSKHESQDEEHSMKNYDTRLYGRMPWYKRHRNALVFHITMILIYIILAPFSWNRLLKTCQESQSEVEPVYCTVNSMIFTINDSLLSNCGEIAPANRYVRYQTQVLMDGPRDIQASPFVGVEPTPEIDAAWEHLLRFHNLRISESEMRKMNKTSIAFARGGGYHGMMAVFHELHCLKLVREAVHPDYYYRDVDEAELGSLAHHTEHCIDILRMAAMCRADTAIFPYHWSDLNRVPNPTWEQEHQCIDWYKLEEFLDARKLDLHEPNVLLHPKYGPSYPGGKKVDEPDGPKVYPEDPE